MRSIAEIISKERDVKILSVNHDILLSTYVGEGENNLRELFKTAHR
jgi:SpoVK/Ycf46/Vps4 family AAA+-type ATPase